MEEKMLDVAEVMKRLCISKSYAYKIIHQLNDEMAESGLITIPGKVSESYLEKRLFGRVRPDGMNDGRN